MKNNLTFFLFIVAMLTLGCNSENKPASAATATLKASVAAKLPDTAATRPVREKQEVVATRPVESKATSELCACVNTYLVDMSPQVRQVIVNAGKSSMPLQTLAYQLQQVKGTAEQEQLLRELEKFESNPQLQRCADGIKQKYSLDDTNPNAWEKVLKAAGENKDCEVLYALMKIGLAQEKMARSLRQ